MTPTEFFRGKVVLVTGAGGSIGSEICRQLVAFGVKELRMLGHSEDPLYRIHKELLTEYNRVEHAPRYMAGKTALLPILGSVTDERLMLLATNHVDIVIHAAAHKHVPLCEENPIQAVLNNVGGTITLAEAAIKNQVEKFVQVSTDKAVKPASVMGRTKRACELFMEYSQRHSRTTFTTVRFGNVLNSAGSVLPLWREQLKAGKPITLTDKRCTRFFMSIPEAADLTLAAATLGPGTFVLDMGEPKSIYQMALDVAREHGPDAQIVETGLRPGEKLTEELVHGDTYPTSIPRVMYVVEDNNLPARWVFNDLLMAATVGAKDRVLHELAEICR